jgi:CDP-diacylglycerol--glycerol-3-phosphate 3-phosphatidyltransferase
MVKTNKIKLLLGIFLSIANYLTFFRILLSPIFLVVYVEHESLGINPALLPYVLICLLSFSELSDAFDGYMARKYNQVTDLGKILDPMADSIARTSVFLTFTQAPVNLPVFLIFVFLYRDATISTLRTICALKGHALAASKSGKIKAVIQAVAAFCILFLMIPHSLGALDTVTLQTTSFWIVMLAALYTVYSGVEYIVVNRAYIAKLMYVIPEDSKT